MVLAAICCWARSLDDAAGEAFDKTAKMLGLTLPRWPALSQLAKRGDDQPLFFRAR